jgi:putative endonuclease
MALWRSSVRARYGPPRGQSKKIVLFYYMFTMYILQSIKSGRYYIGHTDELPRRLTEHNSGMTKYTQRDRPWKLMYIENYATRSAAMRRELEIKAKKSRKYIERVIQSRECPDTTES